MKKTLALVVALLMVVIAAVSCSAPAETSEAPAESAAATEAPAESEAASEAPAESEAASEAPSESAAAEGSGLPEVSDEATSLEEPLDIAVIIKATDSDFWQYMLVGAQNYQADFPDRVKVTTYGPPSEADIDQQVQILEQVITTKPDGILIASTSSDAANAGIESAMSQGIPVVTADNQVTTDQYVTHLATDNLAAGAMAADQFVATLEERGVELEGTVGLVSAMAAVQVLTDREDGFVQRMAEIAPNITVLEKQYADSDIARALELCENIYTANQDTLLGIFASNNQTGDGLARFMTERDLGDKLVGMVFDSDPEEITAIENGHLVGTVVQNPYSMGYDGVNVLYEYIVNEMQFEKYYDTGVTVVTAENIESEEVQDLLDSYRLKRY